MTAAPSTIWQKAILFFATGFGLGRLPWAPGTWGSLLGIGVYHFLSYLPLTVYAITIFVLVLIAAWISTEASLLIGEKDPPRIVIDEVAGMVVSLFFVPCQFRAVLVAFLAFRLFDIWKPFPCKWIQDRLPGGWGIVGDDIMAGIYANLVTQGVIRINGFL